MIQLMALPANVVCCFIKIQIGLIFLVLAYPVFPEKHAINWLCVCHVN